MNFYRELKNNSEKHERDQEKKKKSKDRNNLSLTFAHSFNRLDLCSRLVYTNTSIFEDVGETVVVVVPLVVNDEGEGDGTRALVEPPLPPGALEGGMRLRMVGGEVVEEAEVAVDAEVAYLFSDVANPCLSLLLMIQAQSGAVGLDISFVCFWQQAHLVLKVVVPLPVLFCVRQSARATHYLLYSLLSYAFVLRILVVRDVAL